MFYFIRMKKIVLLFLFFCVKLNAQSVINDYYEDSDITIRKNVTLFDMEYFPIEVCMHNSLSEEETEIASEAVHRWNDAWRDYRSRNWHKIRPVNHPGDPNEIVYGLKNFTHILPFLKRLRLFTSCYDSYLGSYVIIGKSKDLFYGENLGETKNRVKKSKFLHRITFIGKDINIIDGH